MTLTTTMDVGVEWNDDNDGYEVSFDCADEDLITSSGGSLIECYNLSVYNEVLALLNAEGVSSDALVSGGMAF